MNPHGRKDKGQFCNFVSPYFFYLTTSFLFELDCLLGDLSCHAIYFPVPVVCIYLPVFLQTVVSPFDPCGLLAQQRQFLFTGNKEVIPLFRCNKVLELKNSRLNILQNVIVRNRPLYRAWHVTHRLVCLVCLSLVVYFL